jgi:hypothetical protein
VWFLQVIQALAQLLLAEADPLLPAGHVMHRLKDVSRHLTFATKLFELLKFVFELMDLATAL